MKKFIIEITVLLTILATSLTWMQLSIIPDHSNDPKVTEVQLKDIITLEIPPVTFDDSVVRVDPPKKNEKKLPPPTCALVVTKANEIIEHSDLDSFCLAKNIYHEARSEGLVGQLAVAQVTLNRLASPNYPDTICKVVMQRRQFSWANKKSIRWSHPKGKAWDYAKHLADEVLNKGVRVVGLETALFYHTASIKPRWMKEEARLTQIGTHIFYNGAKNL